MGSFSIWHWLIVLLIVVLIFGTKKLRNMGSDVGGAVKNFKEAMGEEKHQADSDGYSAQNDSKSSLLKSEDEFSAGRSEPKTRTATTKSATRKPSAPQKESRFSSTNDNEAN